MDAILVTGMVVALSSLVAGVTSRIRADSEKIELRKPKTSKNQGSQLSDGRARISLEYNVRVKHRLAMTLVIAVLYCAVALFPLFTGFPNGGLPQKVLRFASSALVAATGVFVASVVGEIYWRVRTNQDEIKKELARLKTKRERLVQHEAEAVKARV